MTGTNWDGVARELGFKEAKAMWVDFYVNRKLSLEELARRFGVSAGMIRGQLYKAEIEIKPRGGANYRKIVVTPALVADCDAKGTKLVAVDLGVSYTALHKALKKHALATGAKPLEVATGVPVVMTISQTEEEE